MASGAGGRDALAALGLDVRLKAAASAVAGFLGDDSLAPSSGSASRSRGAAGSPAGDAAGAGFSDTRLAAGGAGGAYARGAAVPMSGGGRGASSAAAAPGLGAAIGGAFSWISQAVESVRALAPVALRAG